MAFVLVSHAKHSLFQFYMIGLPGLTVVFLQTLQFSTSARRSSSVPHKRLLYKLDHYGIRGNLLKWFSSFLLNRNQREILNGSIISRGFQ